jgi:hypothetical protein
VFTVLNIAMVPVSYSVHIVRLLTSLIREPNLYQMVIRIILTVKFAIYGLVYFPVAIAVDTFVFFGNLYTQATVNSMNDKSKKNFSKEGI